MTETKRQDLNKKRVTGLTIELKEIVEEGLVELEKEGFRPLIVQGYRSPQEQDALYLQGRRSLEDVNGARKKVGLDPITLAENERIVTKVKGMGSKHCFGKAVDLVNLNEDGQVDWDDMVFYKVAILFFEGHGVVCGGNWSWTDWPHFEID